ncbi:Rossmann fold nucleotide-binding protein Smf possibly involved in DNA uptake [hydrothermal vent metagenome]|uniref:Rossmann fold nucleotide-binding protein Smf possibly involved in DNA uptake n=1 Tax=hydrothermal vent metagenome TaxID=652676 RepID=A0A3B0Z5L6_9ZZZZ
MNDLNYWLALLRAPKIGPASFHKLLHHYKTPKALFECSASQIAALPLQTPTRHYLAQPDWHAVERDLSWNTQDNHHIITLQDPFYPELLKEIPGGGPPVLFVHGDITLLSRSQIAIVGSRNPTHQGREIAYAFAQNLCSANYAITSGLAIGIDAAAHRGALSCHGTTLAVAATGLDQVYPKRHYQLAQQIIEQSGAIISEFPLGTSPQRSHFPRRNRLISGLSQGTLVVEAAIRSGSLITARFAADQGREVFAIPGAITNPLSRGCHNLIKEGAKLTETADDIMEELGSTLIFSAPTPSWMNDNETIERTLNKKDCAVWRSLGYDPALIDTIIERSELTAQEVSSALMDLELRGYITSSSGGLYARNALRGKK